LKSKKKTVCIAFYEDNNQTLSGIIIKFFKDKKIPISQQTINLLAQRSRGDRQNLKNELEKIESFIIGKDKVETQDLLKLTNLAENYSVSELIDGCLAKNKKKIINILNENNYSTEDCILIIRTFLIKSKRLLKISLEIKNKKYIDDIISFFNPPFFWKDKDII
jgi:DNA polymerase-3 subunit delta